VWGPSKRGAHVSPLKRGRKPFSGERGKISGRKKRLWEKKKNLRAQI